MKIKWLGHSAFLIVSAAGVRIVTDPYQSGSYSGGLGYKPIRESADIVTISHEHADHNYAGDIAGKPEIIRKTGKHEIKGITIEGILTSHDQTNGRQRGLNTVFCMKVDGIRICHLGDLGHELSGREQAEFGEVDVLMIPVGGFYTIDAREATKVAAALRPKLVLPMHYKTPVLDFPITGVDAFVAAVEAAYTWPVRRRDKTEIEFGRATLPGGTEVWVLKHAL
jgi:L-ascorbate metabolism protein UlaG (beta-lactamase superfamily)